ncbi:MAG: SOS response-associated peptidase [Methanomicrobiales archaeon]|nr:SOS response-associated peptidase [Methanomicrobiales archaeon]MDD1659636.1 SOS response-associated peptidase [Methanomicrobiales archaeon]
MCGRFTIAPLVDLFERFHVTERVPLPLPRYNVAPSQEIPVVTREGSNRMEMMRWGLVPSWTKDLQAARKPINARAETLSERPTFRGPLKHHRCLVPSTGFYEWKKEGSIRVPYFVHLEGGALFAFAGIYDVWRDPAGGETRSFTIITTAPNRTLSSLHDRMPAILREEDEERWLQSRPLEPAAIAEILAPFPDGTLEVYRVSPKVNSPAYDGPDLVAPV